MDDIAAVDAYLAAVPEPHRELLSHLRATIRAACPEAREGISYGMPAFRLGGTLLLSYAAFRRHCSLYPANLHVQAELGEALAPFVHEKSTIRFTAERPLPDALVRRLVAVRVAELESAGR